MSDPSQQCPSAWMEYTSNGIRVCARPTSSEASCPGTLYPVSHQYRKVCGRVIGYQIGSPDAFVYAWKQCSSNTAKNEWLFQPSFGYLSFMPLCSASLNTRESHWLLYIPNSKGQFFRTFNLVNAEEGKY